ncbi:serine/threonine-protein kinase [Streptomyces sp. TRM76323]|uniref:Serine/threonine-protein kinase n=1 Tax=Streptomyces tamarix TaxID=3078565 RepID=A0ABU3QDU3_9ACTN|nr:serine/threonine-protein kinase [Streptomyces tamarix]MDT9680886.1 serine/threonine-protein kinase [Streptomyces tamarix]
MPPLRSPGTVPEAEHPEYAGRYRLEDWLGSGGMGVVRLAVSDSGLRLAVKVIHVEHAADPEFRARFRQEIEAARRVSGAFTAPVVDADPEAARPWMATLFIDGPTLSERVKRNGPLDAAELRRLGAGLAEALRDIHRAGVVHRDLKPSNVLLAADGPKVIDFGISRPSDSDVRTETGKLIGTPPFMAPEQFQRPRDVGPAADVFAMGAVLVHAATGRGPFDSNSPYVVAYQVVHNEPDLAGVPEELAPLLRRCLAKDPAQRPTPEQVMVALRVPEGGGGAGAAGGAGRGAGTAGGIRVPEQRGAGDPADGSPADGDPRDARTPAGGGRGGARRLGWVAVAVAVAGALVGGLVAVRGADGRDGAREAGPAAAARSFRAWAVPLGTGAEAARPPVCAAADGALYCAAPGVKAARLGAADGAVVWSVPAGGPAAPEEGAAVVAAGGLVRVVSPRTAAGGDARLEALDPATGAVRWGVGLGAYAQVVHGADTVLVVDGDGRVRALDGATGAGRWTGRPAARGAQWVAGAAGGPVFAAAVAGNGTSTLVSAVDPVDGRVLWRTRVPGSLTPVQATEEALVLLSADKDLYTDAVVRLDLRDRGVRRVALTGAADQAQAVVDGETAYVVGSGGALAAVDLGTGPGRGRELWRLETGAARVSRPVAADGRVFLMAGDGRLLGVDAGRGVLVGQSGPRMAAGVVPLLAAPVVSGGKVYGGAPDGAVFAVDPAGW